jgi:hypothetical protein
LSVFLPLFSPLQPLRTLAAGRNSLPHILQNYTLIYFLPKQRHSRWTPHSHSVVVRHLHVHHRSDCFTLYRRSLPRPHGRPRIRSASLHLLPYRRRCRSSALSWKPKQCDGPCGSSHLFHWCDSSCGSSHLFHWRDISCGSSGLF